MKQTQQPLYPKLSSIYNKILQLASAILLIVVLMSVWQSTSVKNEKNLSEHFNYVAKQQLHQGLVGARILLKQEYGSRAKKSAALQAYLDGLAQADFVRNVHLYDVTGALVTASKNQSDEQSTSETINELYGISHQERDLSTRYMPFVVEIRDEATAKTTLAQQKLLGYLRLTVEKEHLVKVLAHADEDQQSLVRLMLLLAGLVGFLLTRGLNRFSRRGYRVNAQQTTVNTSQLSDKTPQ